MSEPNPYQLSKADHDREYREIEAAYLHRSKAQEHPHAIITGGQPGSGKSGITSGAKVDLANSGGFLLIDADELRLRHPHYKALLAADDRTAANLTHPDAGVWAARLLQAGAEGRRNLIIDQTSKDPAALVELAQKLRGLGYTLELRAMAVHEQVSEQRILMRYERQKSVDGFGRFSTKENHDLALNGVARSVEAAETNRSVDTIRLYDNTHKLIYTNELRNGEWQHRMGAREALDQERSRPMDLQERRDHVHNFEKLTALITRPQRHASAEELQVVEKLTAQAKRELAAEVFRHGQPDQVVKEFPGLAASYQALEVFRDRAKGEWPDRQQDTLLAAAKVAVASGIERGEVSIDKAPKSQSRAQGIER